MCFWATTQTLVEVYIHRIYMSQKRERERRKRQTYALVGEAEKVGDELLLRGQSHKDCYTLGQIYKCISKHVTMP